MAFSSTTKFEPSRILKMIILHPFPPGINVHESKLTLSDMNRMKVHQLLHPDQKVRGLLQRNANWSQMRDTAVEV